MTEKGKNEAYKVLAVLLAVVNARVERRRKSRKESEADAFSHLW